jgi:hypothetical protein
MYTSNFPEHCFVADNNAQFHYYLFKSESLNHCIEKLDHPVEEYCPTFVKTVIAWPLNASQQTLREKI